MMCTRWKAIPGASVVAARVGQADILQDTQGHLVVPAALAADVDLRHFMA